jgi:hypothetical protein
MNSGAQERKTVLVCYKSPAVLRIVKSVISLNIFHIRIAMHDQLFGINKMRKSVVF